MIPRFRFEGDYKGWPAPVHRFPDPSGEYVRHAHLERLLEYIDEAKACLGRGQADKARIALTRAKQYANLQEHAE